MPKLHRFTATKVPNSEHEHGAHYGWPCAYWNVTCSCGAMIQETTCFPCVNEGGYLSDHGRDLMREHRLDWLEQHATGGAAHGSWRMTLAGISSPG